MNTLMLVVMTGVSDRDVLSSFITTYVAVFCVPHLHVAISCV
jgi:hypothetical protein